MATRAHIDASLPPNERSEGAVKWRLSFLSGDANKEHSGLPSTNTMGPDEYPSSQWQSWHADEMFLLLTIAPCLASSPDVENEYFVLIKKIAEFCSHRRDSLVLHPYLKSKRVEEGEIWTNRDIIHMNWCGFFDGLSASVVSSIVEAFASVQHYAWLFEFSAKDVSTIRYDEYRQFVHHVFIIIEAMWRGKHRHEIIDKRNEATLGLGQSNIEDIQPDETWAPIWKLFYILRLLPRFDILRRAVDAILSDKRIDVSLLHLPYGALKAVEDVRSAEVLLETAFSSLQPDSTEALYKCGLSMSWL